MEEINREQPLTLRRDRLRKSHRNHTFWRWCISTMLALGVLYVLLFVCFQGVTIGNDAMAPTLQKGDMVLVDRVGKHMRHPQRTDLIAFYGPEGELLIRRVVGLAGEAISCEGGIVYIDNTYRLEEGDYSPTQGEDFKSVTVSEGCVFVLCDDRQYGLDSRELGCVEISEILGYVNIRFLQEFAVLM